MPRVRAVHNFGTHPVKAEKNEKRVHGANALPPTNRRGHYVLEELIQKTSRRCFSEILPDYDEERVYTSNIKKVIQWYNLLVTSGLDFSAVEAEEENSEKV